MNLADVRSPEWRARATARIGKKLLGFTHREARKSPVLIAGLQRSGTTMLMNIFHLRPDTEVFDEARDSKTFIDFRVRSIGTVQEIVEASHYRFPCFKIIADSHVLRSILGGLPDAKAVWMYREPGPNAASRLKKFANATAAIRAVCEGKPGGGWFAEGVSRPVTQKLQSLDRSRFSEFDYACLVWWVRNQLFQELELANEPRVRLLRYESLVETPGVTMDAFFDWLGMPRSASAMRFVHARSRRGSNLPPMDPQVASLCSGLLRNLDETHAAQWLSDPATTATHPEMRRAS